MRLTSLMLCAVLILFGCGSNDTSELIESRPNYFPDASGSRWVYRDSNGLQWTQEVSGERNIDGKSYQALDYVPPVSETEFDYLKPDAFRFEQSKVFFVIGEKIQNYVQTELPKAAQDELAGLELAVAVEPILYPEFIFLQNPVILNAQWDALNIKVNGSIVLQNLVLLQIPFEVLMSISAEVVAESPLETPAGNFEKSYRIEYQAEITHTLFSATETRQRNQTVWFVPHVGIVRVEGKHGVTELIEYTLVPTIEE